MSAVDSHSSSMFDVEEFASVGTVANVNDLSCETLTQVYNNYSFADRLQNSLPIMSHREKVSKM
jgi:hypothetical protein